MVWICFVIFLKSESFFSSSSSFNNSLQQQQHHVFAGPFVICGGSRTHPRERNRPYLLTWGISPFSASSRWARAQNWIAHRIGPSRSIITSLATFTSLHILSFDLHWLAITIYNQLLASNNVHGDSVCVVWHVPASTSRTPLDESRFYRSKEGEITEKQCPPRDSTYLEKCIFRIKTFWESYFSSWRSHHNYSLPTKWATTAGVGLFKLTVGKWGDGSRRFH